MVRKLMMTARGRVTFPKDVVQHLGINRGEAVEEMTEIIAAGWAGQKQ